MTYIILQIVENGCNPVTGCPGNADDWHISGTVDGILSILSSASIQATAVYPPYVSTTDRPTRWNNAWALDFTLDFFTQCPNIPVVLLGYSEGAVNVGNLLCGSAGIGVPTIGAVNSSHLIAAVVCHDPPHLTLHNTDFLGRHMDPSGMNQVNLGISQVISLLRCRLFAVLAQ